MKWFGQNWGAPVCDLEHVPTPQASCFGCEEPIKPEDQGVVLPYLGGADDLRQEAPYHLDCLVEAVTPCTIKRFRSQS